MAKQAARNSKGQFGKAGDPGVVIRYELNADEYFATLSALDRETQAWVNRTSTSVNKVDKAFQGMATGGLARGGKAMAIFRNAAMLAGYELAGMGGAVGKMSYLLTALGVPLTAVTAAFGAIAALGVAIWKVDAIAAWIEGVDAAKEKLKELEDKLKTSNVEKAKFDESMGKTIQGRRDQAYELGRPNQSPEAALERQRMMLKRQLDEDLRNQRLTDGQRAGLQAAFGASSRAITERQRAIRMGADGNVAGVDAADPFDERLEAANRRIEIGRQDDLSKYMRNMDAWEARQKAKEDALRTGGGSRLSTNADILGGGFGSLEAVLIAQRDKMMQKDNLPWMAKETGIPVGALSQMLGLSNAGVSGGMSVSNNQLSAINRAGGIGGATEKKNEMYFKSLPEIERVLKIIQRQSGSGLKP